MKKRDQGNRNEMRRGIFLLLLLLGGGGATSLHADETITGAATVTGNAIVQGSSIQLGLTSGTPAEPGLIFTYDTGYDQIGFSAAGPSTTWTWQYNNSGTYKPAMTLDGTNTLTLYNRASTPAAGIQLNPSGTSIFAQSLAVNGTNNQLPNQTLTGAGSILTEGLADARYAQSSNFSFALLTRLGWQPAGGPAPAIGLGGGSATAPFSLALSSGSVASGGNSTAVGTFSTANNNNATALGASATASGDHSVAVGYAASASGGGAVAIASNSSATGINSMSLGSWSNASALSAVTLGGGSNASGPFTFAIGAYSTANGAFSTAGGPSTVAQGFAQFVVGAVNIPEGNSLNWVATDDLFIVGNGAATYNLGNGTTSGGIPSDAFTVKKNGDTTVFGKNFKFGLTAATGQEGNSGAALTYDDGTGGTVTFSAVKDASSWYWKDNAGANLNNSAVKNQMSLSGSNVLTIYNTSGQPAIVLDPANPPYASSANLAISYGGGGASVSIAGGLASSGGDSMAIGPSAQANIDGMAIGMGAYADNLNSVAVGINARSEAAASAFGAGAQAMGLASTAVGASTASGAGSIALGTGAVANGNYSVAVGGHVVAAGYDQFVIGQFNVQQGSANAATWVWTDDLFQIGNGTDAAHPSNAFTVDKSGNTTMAGNLRFGSPYPPQPSNMGGEIVYMDQPGPYASIFFTSGKTTDWIWQQNQPGISDPGSGQTQMILGEDGTLLLYNTSGEAAIVLNPNSSVALGENCTASGTHSTAAGESVTAAGYDQFVIGQFNVQQGSANAATWVATDDLFQIGNGTDATHLSNAFTVKKSGDAKVQGTLTANKLVVLATSGSYIAQQGDLSMGDFTAGSPPSP